MKMLRTALFAVVMLCASTAFAAPLTLTQNVDPTLVEGTSSGCVGDGTTNEYAIGRRYRASLDHQLSGPHRVNSVTWGIDGQSDFTESYAYVALFKIPKDYPTTGPISFDEAAFLGVYDQTLESNETASYTAVFDSKGEPVWFDASTHDLVVMQMAFDSSLGSLLFGTNNAGETGDVIVLAPDCGIDELQPVTAGEFDIGLVQSVVLEPPLPKSACGALHIEQCAQPESAKVKITHKSRKASVEEPANRRLKMKWRGDFDLQASLAQPRTEGERMVVEEKAQQVQVCILLDGEVIVDASHDLNADKLADLGKRYLDRQSDQTISKLVMKNGKGVTVKMAGGELPILPLEGKQLEMAVVLPSGDCLATTHNVADAKTQGRKKRRRFFSKQTEAYDYSVR